MNFDLPELPQNWSYASLESCSQPNSVTYGVVQPGAALEHGKALIRVNNFRNTRIDLADVMYISPEIEAKYSRTRLKGGEILLTIVGSVGQVAVVSSQFAGFNVARAVAVIHPLPSVSAEWIALCLRSPLSQHILGSRANTTVQTTINLKDLRALPIPLPPEPERRAIAEFVGTLDDRIALLQETNATLELITQTLFKSWFVEFAPVQAKVEGRVPDGMDGATAALFPDFFQESELGPVPKGWQVLPVGDVVDSVGGGTPDTTNSSYWNPPLHCWTTPKDLSDITSPVLLNTERKLSDQGIAKVSSGLLPAGTLLLSSRAPIGYLALTQVPMAINQGYIALKPGGILPPLYMLFWCKQNMEQIRSRANGSTFMEISKKAFRPIPVVVPPSEVVEAFAERAGALFEKLSQNELQVQTLNQLRDTMLPRLMAGQINFPLSSEFQ
ncbi:type I restriction enzyme, S subunit [Janthinobacterium sp. CG_23.3]|uniref:restriction endonuclease subunit S n=1 Tax=Janthinobacterium sp. CG_23.3 TaxID=3349634 RepID=UPI0038D377CB